MADAAASPVPALRVPADASVVSAPSSDAIRQLAAKARVLGLQQPPQPEQPPAAERRRRLLSSSEIKACANSAG